MRTSELTAEVDERRQLIVSLPHTVLPGPVRLLILGPEPGAHGADAAWMNAIAREWAAELGDDREDLYTLQDGEPLDASR